MKDLFSLVPWPLRWIFGILVMIACSVMWVDDRMSGKVQAAEVRMMGIRRDDMSYLREELRDIKQDTNVIKQALIRRAR